MDGRIWMVGGVLAFAALITGADSAAEARELRRQDPPASEQASPSDVVPVKSGKQAPTQAPTQAPVQAPVQAPGPCCEKHCIRYHHHGTLRKTCASCSTYEAVLCVTDPCCGCEVKIPLCLPCGCDGEPTVCAHDAVLGRHVVVYRWCCGYKVRVVFDRCGDITVHSYGR